MKTTVVLFDGDVTSPEGGNVAVEVDLSQFKSGVFWAKRGTGGSTGSGAASLNAIEDGMEAAVRGLAGGNVGSASINLPRTGFGRVEIPSLPDNDYRLRLSCPYDGGMLGVKVIFVGDDGASSESGGYNITLTGTVERE